MTFLGVCEICGADVRKPQLAAYPVTGWEIQRYGGGSNYTAGKDRIPDRIAHAHCIEHKLKYGGQEQMEL